MPRPLDETLTCYEEPSKTKLIQIKGKLAGEPLKNLAVARKSLQSEINVEREARWVPQDLEMNAKED